MSKKSFSPRKSSSVSKTGVIPGMKNSGSFAGRVKQGGPTKPNKSKTNP